MKKVSAIIVNYNTREYLRRCISSIIDKSNKEDIEIFVVDNNSSDGSQKMIKTEFSYIHLIENKENIGYGRAINRVIKLTTTKYLIILNSDIEFKNDVINEFLNFAKSNEKIGIIGPKLLNSDGTVQVSYNKGYLNMCSLFLDRVLFYNFFKLKIRKNKLFLNLFHSSNKVRKVGWVGGSCLFINKEVLDKVGYFDEEYFMYGEEMELCKRIRNNGYLIYYLPKAEVIHHGFKSSASNFDKVFIEMYKSDIYYFQKYYSKTMVSIAKVIMLIGLLIKINLLKIFKPDDKQIDLSIKTISVLKLKEPILKIYFLFRLPFIFLINLFFKPRRKLKSIKKIIIFRLDRIGDFVLSLPVIDNLKLQYPDASISIVVRPYLKDLAFLIKNIDKVIVYNGKISTINRIRKERYDIAIDLLYDYKLKPAILTFLTKAPIRVGFSWGFRELFFTHAVKKINQINKNIVDLNLELLKLLNVPIRVTTPKINIERKVSDNKFVAIHPGGYYKSQRWDVTRFSLLAKRILEELKEKVIVIGSGEEKGLVDYIVSNVNNENIKRVLPKDIKELVELLSNSKLLICNNSGPLHLANALGIPTISTMGPTDPVLWWPKGDNNIVIRKDVECSPCSLGECKNHKCMDLITVDEMFNAVKRQIV